MTPLELLAVLSLEDLGDVALELEAARVRALSLPEAERTKALEEIEIAQREIEAQIANQKRRTR